MDQPELAATVEVIVSQAELTTAIAHTLNQTQIALLLVMGGDVDGATKILSDANAKEIPVKLRAVTQAIREYLKVVANVGQN